MMIRLTFCAIPLAVMMVYSASVAAAPPIDFPFTWSTVVNNGDFMPTNLCDPTVAAPTSPTCRKFNSYNQPAINASRLVVMRARSKGGPGLGQPVHGVYTRDMAAEGPVIRILDRETLVPPPNNRGSVFAEPPSFPRIDISSNTLATRGNHQPVWQVINGTGEIEVVGTSGIYTNPFGDLITGTSKLGAIEDFSFFEVPERPGTSFDVFPGAPAVTDGNIIVFKGNYTVDLIGKTGVYFRELVNSPIPLSNGTSLSPAGGSQPVVLIANNSDTLIPGSSTVFGSTAPPSAANRMGVFAGFDNEENPTLGGIYLVPLNGPQPPLTTLVSIGEQVPGENNRARFNKLGEGLSFDGRFVAFWGAWGAETKTLVLQCPTEGNAVRNAFCREQNPTGFTVQIPVNQGIFVHDIQTRQTRAVVKAPDDFDDFLYWKFSGRVPGIGEGGEEVDDDDDGEPARWRSSTFMAVSGLVDGNLNDAGFHSAFKARIGEVVAGAYVNPVDGIFLREGPGQSRVVTMVETGMDGTVLDPEALDTKTGSALLITEMGIERDGFRNNFLVINARMGSEETGWAGIYLTEIPEVANAQ